MRSRSDRPLTQVEIERDLAEVISDLEEATVEYRSLGEVAAAAEVSAKVAFAKALRASSSSTVAMRESDAVIISAEAEFRRRSTEALVRAQRELLLTLRARADVLRSLLASVRVQT